MRCGISLFLSLSFSICAAQPVGPSVTTPKTVLGHNVGDDYVLANYRQLADYWRIVDRESDRVQVVSIGKTEEGRDQLMAIISSPENMRQLDRYRGIAHRLALGEATAQEAERLASEGKAVVWIDGGLHATEVLGAQQLIETVYRLASRTDPETMRILNDCIVLVVHANPDGMDLVSDWYMRREEKEERSSSGVPRLYQKYIGHDNNRDFYASTQAETININRVLYREWFPVILYNHHQTAPSNTIMFAPPFRGPFNYHVDPLVQVMTDLVGMAMHTRFVGENKPGVVMRNAASYQTWWNGGLRTTAYFHNIVGILTETFGSPNPSRISFSANRLVPTTDIPFPVEPQTWRFAQSIEYEITANYAILDFASRYRETLLKNSYTMARNAIEKGRRDTWTLYPKRVGSSRSLADLQSPENRDPKGYVLPADQVDFPTAVKFANMLIKTGVTVHRATAEFTIGASAYPAGSLVVRSDQAYRAHVLDMFEPQDYPNDFQYPGGPPIAPYDNAGYTPAFSMGITFDRILEPFTGPFQPLQDLATVPPKSATAGAGGYLLDHRVNNSFIAVNRLLKAGADVKRYANGFVARGPEATRLAGSLARDLGVAFSPANPPAGIGTLGPARVALWDRYGGSMTSGWTRWLLEQFEFPFDVVYPPEIDAGRLSNYDVLILPSDASIGGGRGQQPSTDETIPKEWRDRMGSLTTERSLPKIREFLEAGGTVVAVGGAGSIAEQLGLEVTDHMVEVVNGRTTRLPRDKYYVPTSVLRVRATPTAQALWGIGSSVDVMFDQSPVYRIGDGIRRLLWFEDEQPLRSGWAWGQERLKDGVAAFEATVGAGRLLVFGPEITFRAQPHGTFKMLFNALYKSG